MTSVFSAMNSVTPICYFRSNQILSVPPKHTTRCHRFHNRKISLPLILCFFWSSSTQWILSSTSITFLSLLCAVSQGPNPFDRFQKTLLGNWCQRGRERWHQSLSLKEITSEREREILQGERILAESISQGSQMLGVQEERCHMSSWGERHVHMCLFALVCTSSVHLYLSALIFCSLSSPSIPC